MIYYKMKRFAEYSIRRAARQDGFIQAAHAPRPQYVKGCAAHREHSANSVEVDLLEFAPQYALGDVIFSLLIVVAGDNKEILLILI